MTKTEARPKKDKNKIKDQDYFQTQHWDQGKNNTIEISDHAPIKDKTDIKIKDITKNNLTHST